MLYKQGYYKYIGEIRESPGSERSEEKLVQYLFYEDDKVVEEEWNASYGFFEKEPNDFYCYRRDMPKEKYRECPNDEDEGSHCR